MTKRRVWIPRVAAALVVIVVAVVLYHRRGPRPAGPELARQDGAYGWSESFAVGTTFTDGLNLITVTDKANGPLTLISATPLAPDGILKVLGERARVVPDMLPKGFESGWFPHVDGFPPTTGDAAGGVTVKGLVVLPSKPGEDRWIEFQIGYQVTAPGRSTRTGVQLLYNYDGQTRRAVIPSHLTISAPAKTACPAD
jgi:hypothetical protein